LGWNHFDPSNHNIFFYQNFMDALCLAVL